MASIRYWLLKSEPGTYSFADLVRDKSTAWDGVRNFQARNHLRMMQPGDTAFVYHSGEDKAVVGVATVVRSAYPDPTDKEAVWSAVDLKPERPLARPVCLAEFKKDPILKSAPLVRQSRLSVMPITPAEAKRILALGGKSI